MWQPIGDHWPQSDTSSQLCRARMFWLPWRTQVFVWVSFRFRTKCGGAIYLNESICLKCIQLTDFFSDWWLGGWFDEWCVKIETTIVWTFRILFQNCSVVWSRALELIFILKYPCEHFQFLNFGKIKLTFCLHFQIFSQVQVLLTGTTVIRPELVSVAQKIMHQRPDASHKPIIGAGQRILLWLLHSCTSDDLAPSL